MKVASWPAVTLPSTSAVPPKKAFPAVASTSPSTSASCWNVTLLPAVTLPLPPTESPMKASAMKIASSSAVTLPSTSATPTKMTLPSVVSRSLPAVTLPATSASFSNVRSPWNVVASPPTLMPPLPDRFRLPDVVLSASMRKSRLPVAPPARAI